MAGTPRSASPPTCSWPRPSRTPIFVEYIGGSPYVDGITRGGFALDAEGYLEIPDRPGLGIELDREALAKYTADPAPLFQS